MMWVRGICLLHTHLALTYQPLAQGTYGKAMNYSPTESCLAFKVGTCLCGFGGLTPLICVENPVPSKVFCLPPYTQAIQPYQFGHPYTKKTCLWLKGLPPLESTNVVEPVATWCPSGSYSHKHGEQHKGMFTTDRAKNRAKTFPGVANAMVEQWGPLLQNCQDVTNFSSSFSA